MLFSADSHCYQSVVLSSPTDRGDCFASHVDHFICLLHASRVCPWMQAALEQDPRNFTLSLDTGF